MVEGFWRHSLVLSFINWYFFRVQNFFSWQLFLPCAKNLPRTKMLHIDFFNYKSTLVATCNIQMICKESPNRSPDLHSKWNASRWCVDPKYVYLFLKYKKSFSYGNAHGMATNEPVWTAVKRWDLCTQESALKESICVRSCACAAWV